MSESQSSILCGFICALIFFFVISALFKEKKEEQSNTICDQILEIKPDCNISFLNLTGLQYEYECNSSGHMYRIWRGL